MLLARIRTTVPPILYDYPKMDYFAILVEIKIT